MSPDLVVIGNLLVDDLVFADGRTFMGLAGGAALYAALAARLWGVSVGVSSVAGSDYPAAALDQLAARGVDLAGVRTLGRPGLRTWLLYEERGRRVVHRLGCPAHEEVSPGPDDLPPGWRAARAFHLAPTPLALQRALVARLAAGAAGEGGAGGLLSLDPHQPLSAETLSVWRPILAQLDLLFLGADEFQLGGGEGAKPALQSLAAGRLQWIALKRGAEGGRLLDVKRGREIAWPGCTQRAVEPTGAGDAFAGGLIAGLIAGAPLEGALEQGVVSAGFAIEAVGAAGLIAATPGEAARRLDELRGTSRSRAPARSRP